MFDQKVRGLAYTAGGRSYLANEMIADGEAVIDKLTDDKRARDHYAQLQEELNTPPPVTDSWRMSYIWERLEKMEPQARNAFVSRSDDAELVAAVMHAPSVFPVASDDARQRMMSAYNQKHRPDQVRLATDLETYLSAITNYAAMVKRELRTVLK